MTETCANCGHEEALHSFNLDRSCDFKYCRCKKFKPQNHSPQESQVGLATEGFANFKDKPEVPIKTELGNSPSGTKTQKGCGVSFFEGECRYICGKEGLCPYCKECEDEK